MIREGVCSSLCETQLLWSGKIMLASLRQFKMLLHILQNPSQMQNILMRVWVDDPLGRIVILLYLSRPSPMLYSEWFRPRNLNSREFNNEFSQGTNRNFLSGSSIFGGETVAYNREWFLCRLWCEIITTNCT